MRRIPLPVTAAFFAILISLLTQISGRFDLVQSVKRILFSGLARPLPYDNMAPPTATTRFVKAQTIVPDYGTCKITRYVSDRSGMHVYVIDREGPRVDGFFALATEIHDNSGAPHTLEHLIFLGAKTYPFRNVLEKLSMRMFSSTNAWTANHHTAYTLNSVGWQAFSKVMPMYLEHILLPQITDAAVTTEVWHIGKDGKDGGVVYSEMQALENGQYGRMTRREMELRYPESCGYRYETGGLPGALRNLTVARIRQFHRDMYTPRNLGLLIVGDVDHDDLLRSLDAFEEKIKDSIPPPDSPFKRPWVDSPQPPPLSKSTVEFVDFPEDDESTGSVSIGWTGPHFLNIVETAAGSILAMFLTGFSISVLQNTLVEEEQVASDVDLGLDAQMGEISLDASGVATDKLDHVRKRIHEILKKVYDEPLDMDFLTDCLKRSKRQLRFSADGYSEFFQDIVIDDFVWGPRDGSYLASAGTLSEFDQLAEWTESDWKAYLKKWMLDAPSIDLLGRPSKALREKLKTAEETRIAERKARIGEEGLRELGEKVRKAKEENDQNPPEDYMRQWASPDPSLVSNIKIDVARSGRARRDLGPGTGRAQELIDGSGGRNHPLFIQFHDLRWNFIQVSMHFTLGRVPRHLLPLVGIFDSTFFKTSVEWEGRVLGYEEVVRHLSREAITFNFSASGYALFFSFTIEPEKYATMIRWAKALSLDATLGQARVASAIARKLADVAERKRSGYAMAGDISDRLHIKDDSTNIADSALVAEVYLPKLASRLKADPDEVLGWVQEIRDAVFTLDNMRVAVSGNVSALEHPVSDWDVLTSAFPSAPSSASASASAAAAPEGGDAPLAPVIYAQDHLTADGQSPGKVGVVIVPIAAMDTSFVYATAPGLRKLTDPRMPVALVAAHYLQLASGPLWVAVRGQGFAYTTWIIRSHDKGFHSYGVYRSPDAAKAFIASRDAVARLVSGEDPINQMDFEAAISQVVNSYTSEEESPLLAASLEFSFTVLRGLSPALRKQHLVAIKSVTADDIRAFVAEWFLPIFEPGKANLVITCAKIMTEGLEKSFTDLGFKTTVKQLADFHHDYGIEAVEGVEPDLPEVSGESGDESESSEGSSEED